jgi:hypothetical protein
MSTIKLGNNYEVTIPALTDIADIEEAFTKFYFGSTDIPDSESELSAKSLLGVIIGLIQDVEEAGNLTVQSLFENNVVVDLNTVTNSGFYYQLATPTSGKNYPELQPGVLFHIKGQVDSSQITVQFYISYVNQTSKSSNIWWRASFGGNGYTGWYGSSTLVSSFLNEQGYTTKLGYVDTQKSISTYVQEAITDSLTGTAFDGRYYTRKGTNAGKETARIFVQQNEPNPNDANINNRPEPGDIWLW